MSVTDLTFSIVSTGNTIYDPLEVGTGSVQVRVINYGTDNLTDLGMYIIPSTSLGDIDNPADSPPETDYQDLLTWGSATQEGIAGYGGLKLTVPQNTGTTTKYVTRTQGAIKSNKIPFIDMASGDSQLFTIELETPPAVTARRLFVSLVLE